jgi:O-antigen ligase
MLAIFVVLMLVAGFGWARAARAERSGRLGTGRLAFAHRLPAVAGGVVVLTLAGLVIGGLGERGEARISDRQAVRLASLKSTRYEYWRVGLRTFAENPLQGVGAAGFRVEWLRERPVRVKAVDVHSLPLEMASELGILGLAGLGMLFAGAGMAARRALGEEEPVLAGAIGATTIYAVHSAIDWDWQFPAVTLPAVVMTGALIAASEIRAVGEGPAAGGEESRGRATAVV